MEPLKNMFNAHFLHGVADVTAVTLKGFDKERFLADVFTNTWEQLELKERIRLISTVLHGQMSGDYKKDIKQLLKLTKALHRHAGKDNTFEYMFLPDYIEQYGTGHIAESLEAMETVTILSSCEYAIRPFIINNIEVSLNIMLKWCTHAHPSVRRLASEGCRPRLPWGIALQQLKKDPTPILPILEMLKNDPAEFVRKSVANNLNDIAKDHPGVVLRIANEWKGTSKNTDWIVKHGCRTLLKKANNSALQLFGLDSAHACSVRDLRLGKKKIGIGEYLDFSFTLVNEGGNPATMRVEYAITYAKANTRQSRKVFKITENEYQPGRPISFARRQSFADMTTRKHYAGKHTIAVVINGNEKASIDFVVSGKQA